MPVMLPGKTVIWLSLPNLAHKRLTACAGLLILFACSLRILPAAAQASGSSQAKLATKFDTSNLVIAPNLAAQLAKFKPVRMPYDSAQLTARERQMIGKLVEACQDLDSIDGRQRHTAGFKVVQALPASR